MSQHSPHTPSAGLPVSHGARRTAALATCFALAVTLALPTAASASVTDALGSAATGADTAAAAPAAPAAPPATAAPAALTDLQVENTTQPVGLDVAVPRFSWKITSSLRDQVQESYRVRIASSEAALKREEADAWDSGVVESSAPFGIEYGGDTLESSTAYFWSVDVVTTDGTASAASRFDTGFFAPSDWGDSAWIGRERASDADILRLNGSEWIWSAESGAPYAPGEPRAFRRSLDGLEGSNGKTPTSAEIVITADDLYSVWINGQKLGATAGQTNGWQGAKKYTADLEKSGNVVAVSTDNGAGSPAGLVAVVRVTYADGSTALLRTDTSWKASRAIADGFEQPGFDDSSWEQAASYAAYGTGPWGDGVTLPPSTDTSTPLLRKEFAVDKAVADGRLTVAAGGYADVSLNGRPINDEVLAPGFSNYDDTVQYVVTDVTDQLERGANVVGIELGRGFYGMTNGNVWNWQNATFHDDPTARAVLDITYTDGTTDRVVTDDSWTQHAGATLLDDLYGGDTYDARREQTGFDTAGFAADGWRPAAEVEGPSGTLVHQRQQSITIAESLPASTVTSMEDGSYVVTFPRVLAGWVNVTAEGTSGDAIVMRYGERLRSNGAVDQDNNGGFQNGFQTDRFTLAGTGEPESWEAKFSYKGFQYVQVSGWPAGSTPTASDFTAKAVHTDVDVTGGFESSNGLMNQIHTATVDTLLNNLHGIPTDTPMFEKNGWTGDGMVGAEMFMTNFDVHELFAKWVGDIDYTRGDGKGAPLVIAPASGSWGDWGPAPTWHSAYVLIPWWLYEYGGDIRVLEQYYDGMKDYVNLELGRSPGGYASTSLGDWVSPETSPGGGNAPENTQLTATAYLYYMLATMQKTALATGKTADAADFAAKAAQVKDAFNARFLDRDGGYYRGAGDSGYRQTHNLLALAFGLTPDAAMAQRVADSVAADVVARGNTLNTGSLGTKYILPMLTEYGHADVAYAVATQTAFPSWGYWFENGATSMWEHWKLESRSRGHYFLGTVDDWFYQYVAGIKVAGTGFSSVDIAPAVTEQMPGAKGHTRTPYGTVSTDWSTTFGQLKLRATVPVGSTANVTIPAANAYAVTEGGAALEDVLGVHEVRVDGAEVIVTVGSGTYDFAVDEARGESGAVLDALVALGAAADRLVAEGSLSDTQRAELEVRISAARTPAEESLAASAESKVSATRLAAALTALGRPGVVGVDGAGTGTGSGTAATGIYAWIEDSDLPDAAAATLTGASDAVRVTASEAVTALLGITVSAAPGAGGYKPAAEGSVLASLRNGAVSDIGNARAALIGLPSAWNTTSAEASGAPSGISLGDPVVAGAIGEGDVPFTVPGSESPGDVAVAVEFSYRFGGADVSVSKPVTLVIDSPVSFGAITLEPADVQPGTSSTLTAVVKNEGAQAGSGRLHVMVPEGWVTPLAAPTVIVPAGGETAVSVPVFVPQGAASTPTAHPLGVEFRQGDTVLAAGSATLTVTLADIGENPAGYDHVDLGDAASEQAHGLTASASSGTNTEAGVTRRYAGHLTDFSYFEFDIAVQPGKPFLLRQTETYDKPQTKKYRITVNGEEVHERLFSHTGGVGTETYEFEVDASQATAETVRVRYENLDDHTFYDPSIADVWSRPVTADTVAPQVVATLSPEADPATGWTRQGPVGIRIEAVDDRPVTDGGTARATNAVAAVAAGISIEYSIDGEPFMVYSEALSLDADGDHTLRYRATDAAGNTSAVVTQSIRLDRVGPSTTARHGTGFTDGVARGSGRLDVTATDATSGVASTVFRIDGGDWQALPPGAAITVATVGEHLVEYRSVDVAGNRGETGSIVATIEAAPVDPGGPGDPGNPGNPDGPDTPGAGAGTGSGAGTGAGSGSETGTGTGTGTGSSSSIAETGSDTTTLTRVAALLLLLGAAVAVLARRRRSERASGMLNP